jgi:hypothetical protein
MSHEEEREMAYRVVDFQEQEAYVEEVVEGR